MKDVKHMGLNIPWKAEPYETIVTEWRVCDSYHISPLASSLNYETAAFIAASPVVFTALQDCVNYLKNSVVASPDGEVGKLIQRCEDAISKASGEKV